MALGAPIRARRRLLNAPRALLLLNKLWAHMQKMPRARPDDFRVERFNTFPPLILLFGLNVSHDANCFSLFHGLMSTPISAISPSAAVAWMPSIWVRSTPLIR